MVNNYYVGGIILWQYSILLYNQKKNGFLSEATITSKPENRYGSYGTDAKYETAPIKIEKPSTAEWSDEDLKRICDELEVDLKLLKKWYPTQEKKLFEEEYRTSGDWLDYDVVKSPEQLMEFGKETWIVVYHPADSNGSTFEIYYNNGSNGKHSNDFFANHCMVVEIAKKKNSNVFRIMHVTIEG